MTEGFNSNAEPPWAYKDINWNTGQATLVIHKHALVRGLHNMSGHVNKAERTLIAFLDPLDNHETKYFRAKGLPEEIFAAITQGKNIEGTISSPEETAAFFQFLSEKSETYPADPNRSANDELSVPDEATIIGMHTMEGWVNRTPRTLVCFVYPDNEHQTVYLRAQMLPEDITTAIAEKTQDNIKGKISAHEKAGEFFLHLVDKTLVLNRVPATNVSKPACHV